MDSPEISTIIPTFRRPRELSTAIESVLAQRGVVAELIVVDDSAEGSAQQMVESFKSPRILYVKNPEPSGGVPSVVRNLGWRMAKGAFVHFLDDDDRVAAGFYGAVNECFNTHPEVGVVFGRVEPFGDAVSDEQLKQEREFFALAARRARLCGYFGSRWAFTARMMFNGLLLVTGAGLVRRECVQLLDGFDPLMRIREDWDFYARAIRRFGARFLDRPALEYRISNRSLLHYSVDLTEQDMQDLAEARERKRYKYRAEYGACEYFAVKLFAKAVLPLL